MIHYSESTPHRTILIMSLVIAVQAQTPAPGYLIITTSEIRSQSTELQTFINFKQSQGYRMFLCDESSWGGGIGNVAADNIREWLKYYCDENQIQYLLIVGSPDWNNSKVPMKFCEIPYVDPNGFLKLAGIPTDFYYAELMWKWNYDNDGLYGEYFDDMYNQLHGPAENNPMKNFNGMCTQLAVGRIPYYGILSDLEKILPKIRNYETATDISWRKRCLLPMEPLFSTNDSYGLGEQIKNNILSPNGWKCNRLYDNENFFTGKQISAVVNMFPQPEMVPCNEPNVLREWKFRWYVYRFGLVVWSTHGREFPGITGRLAEDVFYSPSASTLTDQHPAMTFQGSCWTAAPGVTDNIAYSLLLNGGVATIGATSRAVDFENMLSSYVGTYVAQGLAYSYTDYMVSQNLGAGRSLNNAKKKGNRAFPGGEAWVNMLNFNLYGDPSISLAPQTNKGPTNLFGFTLFQKGAAYLTWDDNSNDETGFGVQARQEGTSSWTQYYGTGANGTSYMVSGFTNSANYEFRIHKLPTTSESDYSNIVSVWVNTPGPEPAYPAAPTNLTSAVVSTTQINLSWTDNARDETSYTIKRYCTINGTLLVQIIDTVCDSDSGEEVLVGFCRQDGAREASATAAVNFWSQPVRLRGIVEQRRKA